jgi:hypothetical protein
LNIQLLYIAKYFPYDDYFLVQLHIRDVSKTYPDGVQALNEVQIRAKAGREFPRVSQGGFECSDLYRS